MANTNPYSIPSPMSPLVDLSNGAITQVWLGLIREIIDKGLKPELAPGRTEPFWLSAADLADDNNFIQAGADIGIGVNRFQGWAICDGNGGRPTADDVFLRWSLAGYDAVGATGGSDSSAHVHSVDVPNHGHADTFAVDDHILTVAEMPSHAHVVNGTANILTGGASGSAANVAVTGASYRYGTMADTGGDDPHGHGLSGSITDIDIAAFDSGAASVTDNRPSFKSWVPLMRV